jgi:hypothetical protein
VIAGLPVYVRPQIDPLRRADAIFVLGGLDPNRITLALDLATNGWAPVVVLSNPERSQAGWLTRFCSMPHPHFRGECVIPDPPTTKGEGRQLRRLAAQYRWRTVIVITFRPHISRARFILERCFDGDLVMIASKTNVSMLEWAHQYAYQTAGYVSAALDPGC